MRLFFFYLLFTLSIKPSPLYAAVLEMLIVHIKELFILYLEMHMKKNYLSLML